MLVQHTGTQAIRYAGLASRMPTAASRSTRSLTGESQPLAC